MLDSLARWLQHCMIWTLDIGCLFIVLVLVLVMMVLFRGGTQIDVEIA